LKDTVELTDNAETMEATLAVSVALVMFTCVELTLSHSAIAAHTSVEYDITVCAETDREHEALTVYVVYTVADEER
jgi:hypothetical protein